MRKKKIQKWKAESEKPDVKKGAFSYPKPKMAGKLQAATFCWPEDIGKSEFFGTHSHTFTEVIVSTTQLTRVLTRLIGRGISPCCNVA
jgi:hypothetical protein